MINRSYLVFLPDKDTSKKGFPLVVIATK